jgi:hypothetical protein
MPRVNTQTRSTRGRVRRCGRIGCGREIQPGEKYYSFSFRYGGTQVRCIDHYPKQSELTQSKLSELYAAVESAEDDMTNADTVEDIVVAVQGVEEVARELAEEYQEAAEPFGGAGENAERAEALESYADELSNFSPEEADEEVDCEACEGTGEIEGDCPVCNGEGSVYKDDAGEGGVECQNCEGQGTLMVRCETCEGQGTLDNSEALTDAIEAAREDAQTLLNEMEF